MAKLRWTLVLLAVGIGLPAALIILRATEALEIENATRHETVAERVFDEMERSLSDFLLREEARPASDYDLIDDSIDLVDQIEPVDSVGATTGAGKPLPERFSNSEVPFVLGWFVLPSTGEARSLAIEPGSRAQVVAAMRSAFAISPGLREGLSSDAADETKAVKDARLRSSDADALAPGRTSAVGRARRDADKFAELEADSLEEPSTYEVLQNLNRAGSLRSERQSKALIKRSGKQAAAADSAGTDSLLSALAQDDLGSFADAEDAVSPEVARVAREQRAAAAPRAPESAPPMLDRAGAREVDAREAEAPDFRAKRSNTAIVDPLVGRMTPEGTVVLTRSAWRGARVERQGLVLDRARLIEWLSQRILGETGLGDRASLDFAPFTATDPSAREDAYRYLHRFAEPFEGLLARLTLERLPSLGAWRSIYALALLLAVALVIGLLAVDRMTRVVVDYAQRRSDFVAAVSHELRTPLTAIRMYAEMLRDGLVASESKRAEYYATITDESERLSRLIDNVLEFSRLEQDQRDLNLVVGGLSETVRAASEKQRAHTEREGFELVVSLPEKLPRVHYDRDAVTQIVFNLVDNALKYARQADRKTIEIRLWESGRAVELRVRDFGPGVPLDQQARIFEPFYRIGEELTRTSEGTGIGLALVRELATGMGGSAMALRPDGGGLEVVIAFAPAD